MSRPAGPRWAALGGAAFIALYNLALFLPGAPPKASDSAQQIASVLSDQRGAILSGTYLIGLALIALAFFLGATVRWLSRAGSEEEHVLANAAFAGGMIGVGLETLGVVLFYGAAYKVAGNGDLGVVRALTDGGNAAIELSKFGYATFIAAVSLAAARRALLPRWFTVCGALAVGSLLISGIALFSEGSATQFGGGLDVLGAVPAFVWILALSVAMWRSEGAQQSTIDAAREQHLQPPEKWRGAS